MNGKQARKLRKEAGYHPAQTGVLRVECKRAYRDLKAEHKSALKQTK